MSTIPSPPNYPPKSALSPKHILYSEILAVTSVMRKNSRWASSNYSLSARDSALASSLGLRRPNLSDSPAFYNGNTERDLMFNFQELKREIRNVEDITSIPLTNLLSPFFAIVRSSLSTGPITAAALSSIHSLFSCGIINPESPSLESALAELSSAVSHCKFEPSDSSGDEVVLLRILAVIQDCMCSPVGIVLGDVEVCEMLETVLTTSCQMRLSEILRKAAESTMHDVVRTVFSKLHMLDPAVEELKLQMAADEAREAESKMTVSMAEGFRDEHVTSEVESEKPNTVRPRSTPVESPISKSDYGLPSIVELLRVIINILDPSDQLHTDSTRATALGILNAAFDVAGYRMGDFPSLATLLLDHGCKYLFQLARSDNSAILSLALWNISTMFETMRPHLRLQQELFLAFTIDRLAPPSPPKSFNTSRKGISSPRPGTPGSAPLTPTVTESGAEFQLGASTPRPAVAPARGETRELMLETLSQISRHPSFMVDLYANYDCDLNCENMFERLVDFLTKGVYPAQHSNSFESHQQNSQHLCLDLVLAFVDHMTKRLEKSEEWTLEFPSPQRLLDAKFRKNLVLTGALRFNAKPKAGLVFLEENKLIYADLSEEISRARSLALFLKQCTRLDKRLLGDFISRLENEEILTEFIGLFDFKNKDIADAMREMLETFRLPGESQQIERITATFAKHYIASEPAEIKSQDAVHVLAYSVIMLNTDLHNPQVRKRMSIDDYKRNLRGVNDGEDFSSEFLQNIYDSIRKREIVMPEEHTGQVGFEYAWKELLTRSRQGGDFISCNTSVFDMEMFKIIWKPVISAIAYAFISFEDDYIIERSIAGFRQCATLAGNFHLPDVFDFVVVSLSQATSLLSESLPTTVPNYPVVTVEGQPTTVSTLSVKFGKNFRGQLAAVVLFNIVNGNGNALREGWNQIFEMFTTLFVHSLLPTRMLQMEDFLGGTCMIPLRGNLPSHPAPRSDGLLSALSSYLLTPYSTSHDQVPEATDSEIESTLCAIDCITSCRLDELYGQIMLLDLDALIAAVRALEALAHDRTVTRLKQESDDIHTSFNNLSRNSDGHYLLPYDPASVFLLEMMVSIVRQTPQHIEELWPIVFEHISALLSVATQYSVLLIERAIVGLFRLCSIVARKPSMRDQLYVALDLVGRLPQVTAFSVAEQIMSGLVQMLQDRQIISSQTEWNIFFAIVRVTVAHQEAAQISFDLISGYISDGPAQLVTVDNFNGLVIVLDEYALVANDAIDGRRRDGRRLQQLTSSNSPIIERGRKAIDLLFEIKRFIPTFVETSKLSPAQAWRQLGLPLLTALSRQSTNASREIRQVAILHLQRVLLGPHILLEGSHIEEAFNRVVFPLLGELLKPDVFHRDPAGMPETRLRASALLCKTFMQLEVRDGESQADIRVVWIQVLDLLDRLMNIDRQDQLYEAVPESLKNVILVMNTTGMLVPPSEDDQRSEGQRQLWTLTEERIDRFLPGFLATVIPQSQKPKQKSIDS